MGTPPGPSAPSPTGPSITVYPLDLFSSTNTPNPNVTGGGFYTQIQLVKAEQILTGISFSGGSAAASSGIANPTAGPGTGTSVYLPLPWKINDIEVHAWNDSSFYDHIPVINELAKLVALGARAAGSGVTINPFQYMMYKQPAFREFE